jgi:N-acetylated-alpha-linked acidic dipeptidase
MAFRKLGAFAALAAALCMAAGGVSAAPKLFGPKAPAFKSQAALEAAFDAAIDPAEQGRWLKQLSAGPNHVGSPHDKANAEWMLAQYKAFGWDARIEEFQVLYPTPIETRVELLGERPHLVQAQEPRIDGDATSGAEGMLPPYVAYQGDGDVTAELVYVNYGMPDDYKALARKGIDVKGKIVIARYGGGWRGLKPKLAQEHGAVGALIYSDPKDDGYGQDLVLPEGGMRPSAGVQRGSVADMPTFPGDPLTPGVGATKDARRLTRETAPTILKIPTLPISYGDAQHLLSALKGPMAPADWRGGLPLAYRMGPGPAKVHLVVRSEWSLKTIYDVIAVMRGAELPDQWIVRGNHHDGWVFGANDPLSGNVAMLAEAKAIGQLVKRGWRPKRTLVYASWDGEEPGLLGSTEWAETHAAELKQKAVLYINSDSNGRGFLDMAGSHAFQRLLNAAAKDVTDPETGVSADKRLRARLQVDGWAKGASERDQMLAKAAAKGDDIPLDPLGSGSDYSSFLQHLGVPAVNVGFGGEDESGGVYHSIYDSYDHVVRFDDPGFKYAAALSKYVGRLVLRVSEADLPVQRFGDFAETVERYATEVHKLADGMRDKTDAAYRLSEADAWRLASDPLKPTLAPEREAAVPYLEFASLDNAVRRLKASAKAYDEALAAKGAGLGAADRRRLSELLQPIDQLLLDERGLPGRPWYRNMVYAPGMLTGYGAKTLPAVREAIEGRRWDEANRYMAVTAAALDRYSARLDEASALLRGS